MVENNKIVIILVMGVRKAQWNRRWLLMIVEREGEGGEGDQGVGV
jgi:hypothetical protein